MGEEIKKEDKSRAGRREGNKKNGRVEERKGN